MNLKLSNFTPQPFLSAENQCLKDFGTIFVERERERERERENIL
jgi:hypothetical protein